MNNTWKTLSALNVNDDKEKKGRFDYLSWAHAWKHVKNNTENANYELLEDIVYPDNSREVRCSVTIDGITHMAWLAVMDNNNRAIKNPDARAINDARQRCFVKAIAMHGLALYIYQGEGLPDAPDEKPKKKKPEIDMSVQPQEPEPEPKEGYRLVWHNGEVKDICSFLAPSILDSPSLPYLARKEAFSLSCLSINFCQVITSPVSVFCSTQTRALLC